MKNVFYRISYYRDDDDAFIQLFGVIQNSLLQTVSELQLGNIKKFNIELVTAEEFNEFVDKPYTIPTK